MKRLPLILNKGHLFVELDGHLWLFDTGAPTSFGAPESVTLVGEQFHPGKSYFGLTAETLSQFVGIPCSGLLGGDILGNFDHLIDATGGELTVSSAELPHTGKNIPLDEFMGIPILTAQIGGNSYRMFFDTGAQISYFQDDSLSGFPPTGIVTDFYPGAGQFQTETHAVPVMLGDTPFDLQCGSLPGLLGATLMMADTQGIIGNQVLLNRVAGFFPRRALFCL